MNVSERLVVVKPTPVTASGPKDCVTASSTSSIADTAGVTKSTSATTATAESLAHSSSAEHSKSKMPVTDGKAEQPSTGDKSDFQPVDASASMGKSVQSDTTDMSVKKLAGVDRTSLSVKELAVADKTSVDGEMSAGPDKTKPLEAAGGHQDHRPQSVQQAILTEVATDMPHKDAPLLMKVKKLHSPKATDVSASLLSRGIPRLRCKSFPL